LSRDFSRRLLLQTTGKVYKPRESKASLHFSRVASAPAADAARRRLTSAPQIRRFTRHFFYRDSSFPLDVKTFPGNPESETLKEFSAGRSPILERSTANDE
jgi:hypothetical protein